MGKKEKAEGETKVVTEGRPPFAWTEEIEDAIMDEIMEGRSFRDFMVGEGRDHRFPSVPTFFKRLRDDEAFFKRYARAREFQADQEFEEMKEIADNSSNDWMERNDPENPGYVFNHDHVQRSKLRIDTRKFRVVKMAPKKYGDKVEMEHSGEIRRPATETEAELLSKLDQFIPKP